MATTDRKLVNNIILNQPPVTNNCINVTSIYSTSHSESLVMSASEIQQYYFATTNTYKQKTRSDNIIFDLFESIQSNLLNLDESLSTKSLNELLLIKIKDYTLSSYLS